LFFWSGTSNLSKNIYLIYQKCAIPILGDIMKYINRTLEKTLSNYIGKYPVIMITGQDKLVKLPY